MFDFLKTAIVNKLEEVATKFEIFTDNEITLMYVALFLAIVVILSDLRAYFK